MLEKQRQDDDIEQKDDTKEQGEGEDSNSGIHKYFGKANKSPKLFSSKVKKVIRSGQLQNLQVLIQNNLGNGKQLQKAHEKTKAKFEYRLNTGFFQAKPKIKLTLNPFLKAKIFEQFMINWKNTINKVDDENVDIKLNQKQQISLKYKRTKFFNQKRLRARFQGQTLLENEYKFKSGFSFETLLKKPFFDKHEWLNSGQLKSKVGLKDFDRNLNKGIFKFDFSEKLTYLINEYKIKQQSKLNLSYGELMTSQLKSNVEITSNKNTWTAYGGIIGNKEGLNFDQFKFVYSMYDNWKSGFMLGNKNSWQIMIQNPKLNHKYCSSLAFYLGNKNYAMIFKNRFNRKQIGKINYEISLQNGLRNTNLSKVNIGFMVNVNL